MTPPGVKRCSRCGFDAAPEHFKGNLCSMCAEPCVEPEGVGRLHVMYDRYATMVRYKQRVISLDTFYAEQKERNKGSKRLRSKFDPAQFSVVLPVPVAKRGVKSGRLRGNAPAPLSSRVR